MKTFLTKPWFTTLLGIIAGILILAGSFLYLFREHLPQSTFTFLGERAFGDLSFEQAPITDESLAIIGEVLSDEEYFPVVSDWRMEEETAYEYIFEGNLPDLTTIDATVYRRVNSLSIPKAVSEGFSQLTVGILPLSTFQDLEISNITLKESDSEGYSIYLDTLSNNISISRSDEYWEASDRSNPITSNDIPSNEELIDIADKFLKSHNIDFSSYGTPSIDRSFFDPDSWIPDTMNIIYPNMIHDTQTWTMWGQPSGLSVSVSLRTDDVESLWVSGSYGIEASKYELTTNTEKILSVAKHGGLWEHVPENPDITYTFILGEPDIVLAEHYQYTEEAGSHILYVPAFRFPIIEGDADAPLQKQWIVVPLLDDILNEPSYEPLSEPFLILEDVTTSDEVIK